MIFIFFTGLGPGGLRKASGFTLNLVCVPGSSHGGIALARESNALYSNVAYDQQDTVSLLGGSGGEKNYLISRTKHFVFGQSRAKVSAKVFLQYTFCSQIDNHFKTTPYSHRGQRQTGG